MTSAARDCTPAKAHLPFAVEVVGVQVTSVMQQEIMGPVDGGCLFTYAMTNSHVSFAPETAARLKRNGMTDEDIASKETQARTVMASKQQLRTCTPSSAALVEALNRWKSGQFGDRDAELLHCRSDAKVERSTSCGLEISQGSLLLPRNASLTLSVQGNRGKAQDVAWQVEGPRVVALSTERGTNVLVSPIGTPGSTTVLRVVDRAVGPSCFKRVTVQLAE